MANINDFEYLYRRDPEINQTFNALSEYNKQKVMEFINDNAGKITDGVPDYFKAVIQAASVPNGLISNIQYAANGEQALNAISKLKEQLQNKIAEQNEISKKVNQIISYIDKNVKYADLTDNWSKIPSSEREHNIKAALFKYGDSINSSQLRQAIAEDAAKYKTEVHIKTSHAERLDAFDR